MRTPVYLINISGGHYKYYDMYDNGDSTFTAVYGRIDSTRIDHTYPISKWESKYREKINRKGYSDVSGNSADIGAAVKTPDNKMAIIIASGGGGGRSGIITVETEQSNRRSFNANEITPTGIDLGLPLHKLFYKHLCELHEELKSKSV